MRVCDITRTDDVTDRFLIVRIPLDARNDSVLSEEMQGLDGVEVVHDIDAGSRAASAIQARDWKVLAELKGEPSKLLKNPNRSAGARKAAETRRQNREAEQERLDAAGDAARRMDDQLG